MTIKSGPNRLEQNLMRKMFKNGKTAAQVAKDLQIDFESVKWYYADFKKSQTPPKESSPEESSPNESFK